MISTRRLIPVPMFSLQAEARIPAQERLDQIQRAKSKLQTHKEAFSEADYKYGMNRLTKAEDVVQKMISRSQARLQR